MGGGGVVNISKCLTRHQLLKSISACGVEGRDKWEGGDLRGSTAATLNMFRLASAVGPTSPVKPEARCYGGACTA